MNKLATRPGRGQLRRRRRREHHVGDGRRRGRREPVGGRHRARRAARDQGQRLGSLRDLDEGRGHRRPRLDRPRRARSWPSGARWWSAATPGDDLGDSIYEARVYVRGEVASLGADCIEKEMRRRAPLRARRAAARAPRPTPTRPTSGATARPGSSTPSTSTTRAPTDDRVRRAQQAGGLPARARRALAPGAARVGALRPQRDPRDPPDGAGGDLRHPRLRRQAARAPLRRPALPRRQRLALPARGLPRALRHRRHPRHPLREASRSTSRSRSRSPG